MKLDFELVNAAGGYKDFEGVLLRAPDPKEPWAACLQIDIRLSIPDDEAEAPYISIMPGDEGDRFAYGEAQSFRITRGVAAALLAQFHVEGA